MKFMCFGVFLWRQIHPQPFLYQGREPPLDKEGVGGDLFTAIL